MWSPGVGQPGAAAGSPSGDPALTARPDGPLRLGLDGEEGLGLLWSPSPNWEVPGGCWSSPELLC